MNHLNKTVCLSLCLSGFVLMGGLGNLAAKTKKSADAPKTPKTPETPKTSKTDPQTVTKADKQKRVKKNTKRQARNRESAAMKLLASGEPTPVQYADFLKGDASRIGATNDHPSSLGVAAIRRLVTLTPAKQKEVLKALENELMTTLKSLPKDEKVLHSGAMLNLINAIGALGEMGQPVLEKALGIHPTIDLFLARKLGPKASQRASMLLSTSRSEWYWLGIYAAAVTNPNAEVVPDLFNRIRDDEWDFSKYYQMVLARVGESGVPQVTAALTDSQWFVRFSAARALEMIGPKAKTSLPQLKQRFEDAAEDMDVRTAAARAIARIEGTQVEKLYAQLPNHESEIVASARAKSQAWRATYLKRLGGTPFPEMGIPGVSGVSGWSQSAWLVAAFSSGQNLEKANAVLLEWLTTKEEFGSTDSNYVWIYMTCRAEASKYPGRLKPEVAEAYKKFCFRLLNRKPRSKPVTLTTEFLNNAISNRNLMGLNDDLPLDETIRDYIMLSVLKDDPAYKGKTLTTGDTIEQRFEAFNRYYEEAFRQWALYGIQYQIGSSSYTYKTYPHYFNLMAHAPNPKVRKLARMFMDVAMLEWEQMAISGLRSGSKGRAKRGGHGARWNPFQALLTGERGNPHFLALPADSDYVAPEPVLLLRKLGKSVKNYEIINDRPTSSAGGAGFIKSCDALNYAWVTPEYVSGCGMYDPNTPTSNGAMGRWSGVTFRNLGAISLDAYTGEKWNVQHKDVRITQQCSDGPYTPGNTCLTFEALSGKVSEKGGWLFVNNDDAYGAVKIVDGGYFWMDAINRSLFTNNRYSPIIIQTGQASIYGSFENFQSAILKAPLSYQDNKLTYHGPNSKVITFTGMTPERRKAGEKYTLPTVDGKPVDLDPQHAYFSPYMKNKVGSQVIELSYGDRTWHYDFEHATVTEVK